MVEQSQGNPDDAPPGLLSGEPEVEFRFDRDLENALQRGVIKFRKGGEYFTNNLVIQAKSRRKCGMQMKPENLPILIDRAGSSLRGAEWGGMVALLYTIPAGTNMKPLMAGMPDDLCQCPHWGFVLKGRLRISHKDFEEVVSAGELFYAEPGHAPTFEEDT